MQTLLDSDEAMHVAEQTFIGDLVKCVLDEMKAQPDVWEKMSEHDQTCVIERLQLQVVSMTKRAMNILAARGNISIKAQCEQVTFKNGVKSTLILDKANPDIYSLAENAGHEVLLVIPPSELLEGKGGMPEADKDQKEIFGGEDEAIEDDPLYPTAKQKIKSLDTVSISKMQRQLKIGYNRAACIIESLEQDGLITAMDSSGVRTVIKGAEE